jgi:hypothetical protein
VWVWEWTWACGCMCEGEGAGVSVGIGVQLGGCGVEAEGKDGTGERNWDIGGVGGGAGMWIFVLFTITHCAFAHPCTVTQCHIRRIGANVCELV